MKTPERIGIALRPGRSGEMDLEPLLAGIVSRLVEHGAQVLVESEDPLPGAVALPRSRVLAAAELVIAIGGDGTVLGIVRDLGEREVPLLGVNQGHLGFLSDVRPDAAIGAIDAVFEGRYQIRERTRLQVAILSTASIRAGDLVLNDVVFTKGKPLARMIELEARIDGESVASYRSDGLIVATPTGSTAYNLSAGGPLLDPELGAMVLNPICPHTLTQRPLVLPDSVEIEVELVSDEDVTLTLDGQIGETLCPGDRVRVTRSPHPARFVEIEPYRHFETLHRKLRWGEA